MLKLTITSIIGLNILGTQYWERKVFSVEGVKPVRKPSSIQQMASNLLGKLGDRQRQ